MPPAFHWPVRIYWEDTDAGGVVFYANYLKYMERARTEWLRALGHGQHHLQEVQGVLFVVRRVEVDYLRSAVLDDHLWVGAQLAQMKRASLVIRHDLQRETPQGDWELLCRGEVRIACLDARRHTPCPIPEAVARSMNSGEPLK
ncbi:MAG: tol-pal system-associated acyl-CoA thioesterase [Ectothiorhodospira sp.]